MVLSSSLINFINSCIHLFSFWQANSETFLASFTNYDEQKSNMYSMNWTKACDSCPSLFHFNSFVIFDNLKRIFSPSFIIFGSRQRRTEFKIFSWSFDSFSYFRLRIWAKSLLMTCFNSLKAPNIWIGCHPVFLIHYTQNCISFSLTGRFFFFFQRFNLKSIETFFIPKKKPIFWRWCSSRSKLILTNIMLHLYISLRPFYLLC